MPAWGKKKKKTCEAVTHTSWELPCAWTVQIVSANASLQLSQPLPGMLVPESLACPAAAPSSCYHRNVALQGGRPSLATLSKIATSRFFLCLLCSHCFLLITYHYLTYCTVHPSGLLNAFCFRRQGAWLFCESLSPQPQNHISHVTQATLSICWKMA